MTVAVSSSGMRDMLVGWAGTWVERRAVGVMVRVRVGERWQRPWAVSVRQAQRIDGRNCCRHDRRDVPSRVAGRGDSSVLM